MLKEAPRQCLGVTKWGERCKNTSYSRSSYEPSKPLREGLDYCSWHLPQARTALRGRPARVPVQVIDLT